MSLLEVKSQLRSFSAPERREITAFLFDLEDEEQEAVKKTNGVCGGDACISNTRIPVWTLEQSRRLGFSDADLLDAYPSLNRNDLAAAWRYVAAHKDEIETAIRENEEA